MKTEIEVTIKIPAPPDGWVFDGYRLAKSNDLVFVDECWQHWGLYNSRQRYPIAVKVKQYREPVLPADWGKECEFSNNGMIWDPGQLSGYVLCLDGEDNLPWKADDTRYYQSCRIEVSE
jgi:hypothetical protein